MKKKGFTLIELLVVLGILSIVVTTIFSIFSSTMKIDTNVSNRIELQESASDVKRSLYNDIRKANIIVDGDFDSSLNRWIFMGDNMDQNNAYCRLKGYKPLIYMEEITGARVFYAYDEAEGELKKISIPDDNSTTTKTVFYPTRFEYDDATNKGSEWNIYEDDPHITYNLNGEIFLKGLVISTKDKNNNPVTLKSFTKKGAFAKSDGSFVVLQALNSMDGKNPWVVVQIKSEKLVYYTKTSEMTVSEYLIKDGVIDGIILTRNSIGNAGESLKGYYDIHQSLKKKESSMEFDFRVSMVDYGGDI